MYKRIFCFVLSMLMLCGMFSISVSADPVDPEITLINKCKAGFMEEFGIATELEDEVYIEFAVKFANYTVFRATFGDSPALETYDYIDGYWFWAGAIFGDEDYNPTGLYTLDNYGNVESLKETAGKGFIDMDEIYPELSEATPMYIAGDIDDDKKLTVKDATVIQKYLAKVSEGLEIVNNHRLGYCLMETDQPWAKGMFGSSAEVTIKDATHIQKKVAKIIIDEEMPPFYDDRVILCVENENTKEYTLEDFSEYEFESMESWGSKYSELRILTLYLKNPSKTNVIDAVNSLKHREGTEFSRVTPEYIPTHD